MKEIIDKITNLNNESIFKFNSQYELQKNILADMFFVKNKNLLEKRQLFADLTKDKPELNLLSIEQVGEYFAKKESESLLNSNKISFDIFSDYFNISKQKWLDSYYDVSDKERKLFDFEEQLKLLKMPEYKNVIWLSKETYPCRECQTLNGAVFPIDEIIKYYPRHPNCKCYYAPTMLDANYISALFKIDEDNKKATAEVLDGIQIVLDIAGLVPGIGEVADGSNALIHIARKDYINASLSLGAMIPFVGWFSTGTKFVNKGAKVLKITDKAVDTVKVVEKTVEANKVANKMTKNASETAIKRTWQESEDFALKKFSDLLSQKSFLNGVETSWGTKGSVRIDGYKHGFSLEVKNYDLSKQSNINNLIYKASNQINYRNLHLPNNTKQYIMIDIKGQNVAVELQNLIEEKIRKKSVVEVIIEYME